MRSTLLTIHAKLTLMNDDCTDGGFTPIKNITFNGAELVSQVKVGTVVVLSL